MNKLHRLGIAGLSDLIARREVSPVEVTRAQLDRIGRLDPSLHAYAFVMGDEAMAMARRAEQEIVAGQWRGPLHGVPLGIKDLFWVDGVPSAGGMAIHRGFRPARDATAVARLRAAGAVFLGKLQMTEGAYSDHHASITPPVNPWNAKYWTGISSSGPASALAAGLCFGALASDTGGSIRWPCSASGLSGMKPSWGRVSRDGAWPLAPTMDHVGTMARSVEDAALLLEAVAGPDPRDRTAMLFPFDRAGETLAELRIGVDSRWNEDDVEEPVRVAVQAIADTFGKLGAMIVEVEAPDRDLGSAIWPGLCAAEAAVAHAATYPARRDEYGAVLAGVIERGRAMSAMDYQRLQLRRLQLAGEINGLFSGVDLLLCPVQPFGSLTLERLGTMGEQPELISKLQRFTAPFDLTGSPTVVLPGGHDEDGMPIGVQLVAGSRCDQTVIEAARWLQKATTMHLAFPSGIG